MSAKEQLLTLPDRRLHALAFNVWRSVSSVNEKRRRKAERLHPLLRAELAARKMKGASA